MGEPARKLKLDKTKKAKNKVLSIEGYVPKTPFGRRLLELRQQIIASGAKLLTWDEIEEEKKSRRGERQ